MTVREFLIQRFTNAYKKNPYLGNSSSILQGINVVHLKAIIFILRVINGDDNPDHFSSEYKCNDTEYYYDFSNVVNAINEAKENDSKKSTYARTETTSQIIFFRRKYAIHNNPTLIDNIKKIIIDKYQYDGNTDVVDVFDKIRYDIIKEIGFIKITDDHITAIKYFLFSCGKDKNGMEVVDMNGIFEKVKEMIEIGKCHQIIFTGAPGTGKTFTAKKLAKALGAELKWKKDKDNDNDKELPRYEFVQFHPSYDYTDFVEGLRPIEANNNNDNDNKNNNNISFKRVDGIFKAFCREVVNKNKENKESKESKESLYFFIIDEINRANLSKVFGELMYCLESDKRGENNRVKTQYSNLKTYNINGNINGKKDNEDDVFIDGFYIPENVVIIGTMNDIDRSVDSMDFALRRRFEWVEFEVTQDSLNNAFNNGDNYPDEINKNAGNLAEAIDKLNKVIEKNGAKYGLNKQYFISQGHFANIPENYTGSLDSIKEYVWKYRIESLLREYLRGENETDIENFITACGLAFEIDINKNSSNNAPAQSAGENKNGVK